jgi:hypothetical protein
MPFFSPGFSATVAPKESGGGSYLNASSIEDGGNVRFSILSEQPLEGFEVWFTKTGGGMTKRITPEWPDAELLSQLENQVGGTVTERDGRKAIKPCSAFAVYDYEAEAVRVFSANQKSLLAELTRLFSDEDYSDLSEWDVKVTRTGKDLDTRYHAVMVPTKRSNTKVAQAVINAWDEACSNGFDLEALYDGGNPFGTKS